MSESSIEWTDVVWNPVRGCAKISPGCKFCYAEAFAERWRGVPGHPYEQGFDKRLVPEKLMEPLHWRKHRRVFVNSMSDLFWEEVPFEYIDRAFATMLACHVFENMPDHSFQLLTKRAERMAEYFSAGEKVLLERWGKAGDGRIIVGDGDIYFSEYVEGLGVTWPLPNVWAGVSVEDRKYGLPRVEHLRRVPAAVRFLSVEPLLEDLGDFDLTGISWVLVGGESGGKARGCDLRWIRNVVSQCRAASVPVFVKQIGRRPFEKVPMLGGGHEGKDLLQEMDAAARRPWDGWTVVVTGKERFMSRQWKIEHPKGGDMAEWPEDLRVRMFPGDQWEARP